MKKSYCDICASEIKDGFYVPKMTIVLNGKKYHIRIHVELIELESDTEVWLQQHDVCTSCIQKYLKAIVESFENK